MLVVSFCSHPSIADQLFSTVETEVYMLSNRAFQQVTPNTTTALEPWQSINSAVLNVIADSAPVSSALPNSLQLTIPAGVSGAVGFANPGYWGINVNSSWVYNASLYYRFPYESSFAGNLTIGLQAYSGEVFASKVIPIDGAQTNWTYVKIFLQPSASARTTNNTFFVTVNTSGNAEETINFAFLSLFPPTYKDRPNGMRIDIAETLAEMGPAFFRFPGGNNLGQTTATRWQWNATVGPLLNRPGRVGDWGYVNTDGLGLLEYLTFFEDVGMEPIMAVWAGYSLGGTSLPENELAPYIQQAKDQINFVIGDPATSALAALRASLGHAEPFYLQYVEVGNEDFFASTTWRDFVGNLSAEFPQLKYIATAYPFNPIISPDPLQYDVHVYQTPSWFAENSFYYDKAIPGQRNGTRYFEGEYAAISLNETNLYGTPDDGRLLYPTVQSSTGEAAFMTGLERNSDIVFAASYAPLLQHVNSSQWVYLISFDAAGVVRSTSYYVQKLFSLNRGDLYLPSSLPTYNGTLFWTVSRSSVTGDVFIKVRQLTSDLLNTTHDALQISNTVATPAEIAFELPFPVIAEWGTLQLLEGAQNASNTPEMPGAVVPVTSYIATGNSFEYTAPGYSVSVLTVGTAD
ncbi:Probable alpha-L-arabinofuranosidase [Sparassis crispa]|uniref:non-reducing end alpha-L-arabinofuranosidase n=1 Tax=Sparassis crispa TaxID=139825 RepID=A0A401GZR1_9APHY|nr:Probable alpha-L-arabinofuranosidase [Sparassis crispa]GBE87654.1 Probable alpha-L-arabinofuranosidase [Sparassis crispa]